MGRSACGTRLAPRAAGPPPKGAGQAPVKSAASQFWVIRAGIPGVTI